MLKKILLIITLILIIGIIFVKINAYRESRPEFTCNTGGGFWTAVKNCENLCSKNNQCSDELEFGCWCGLDQCWDGKECKRK